MLAVYSVLEKVTFDLLDLYYIIDIDRGEHSEPHVYIAPGQFFQLVVIASLHCCHVNDL